MANFTRYKIPNDFLKRMINYKLINVLPSFKWKLNGWKEKRSTQYRNIFDNSFSPSKLTDRKNRLEKKKKKYRYCEKTFDTTQRKNVFIS